MYKILILSLILISIAFSQTGRENFLGGYDVTVDEYQQGVLCSYWKAIKFTPISSGVCDTLKWGYITTNLSSIDSICLAVFTSDEVNNIPDDVMFYGLVENWIPPAQGVVDIAIPVTNIVTTTYLDANTNYFISMYTSASNEPHLIARGNGSSCNPNPRKVGCATSRVAPPPDGTSPGEIWNVIYANNCYGWGAYSSGGTVSIEDHSTFHGKLPDRFTLFQNFPNPFNPTTMIKFQLPISSRVRVTVHDILGREISTLTDHTMPAGEHQLSWDASDQPSGIYYYKMEAGNFTQTRKMVLMK
jgi:hypothetical protein